MTAKVASKLMATVFFITEAAYPTVTHGDELQLPWTRRVPRSRICTMAYS
jgi:hypothetical protein